MSRARLFAARIAGLIAGLTLSMAMVAPVAHADDLANLRGIVNRDRATTTCQALKYNQTLQDIGFAMGQFIPEPQAKIDGLIAAYGGEVRPFIGVGDPIADATTDAYKKGAGPALSDCSLTEFGVSFSRYETTETDWVGIVFGKPSVTTPPSGPGAPGNQQAPAEVPPVQCGPNDETPTVPAGQQCKAKPAVQCPPGGPQKEVPAGQTCPAPANAVTVSFQRSFPNWTVNVKNNAGIGGSCHYEAVDTGGGFGASEDFNIEPNGNASFQKPAPVLTRSYNVTTTCTGTYDGKQVQFGNDKQTIP
jgi:hypothetical protein